MSSNSFSKELDNLFSDEAAIDRARALAAAASSKEERKLTLPEVIPGFKASTLDICECSFHIHISFYLCRQGLLCHFLAVS